MLACGPAAAVPPDLLEAVPANHLFALLADFTTTGAEGAGPAAGTGALLETAGRLVRQFGGALGWDAHSVVGTTADVLSSVAVCSRFPLAVVITDASARQLPSGGHRLGSLQGALILRTGGKNADLIRQIQSLLSARTDTASTSIERREEFGTVSCTLRDNRLSPWLVLKWAAVGDFYVVAIGEPAFAATARTIRGEIPGLARDPWLLRHRHPEEVAGSYLEWTVDFAGLRKQLRPTMGDRPDEFIAAIGFEGVERAWWPVVRRGRAILAWVVYAGREGDRRAPIARDASTDPVAQAVVPPEAETYALIRHPVRSLLVRVREAWLRTKGSAARARIMEAWREFEEEVGFSLSAELLDQVGERIIIHNYPPHPLGIPLLCTVLLEIEGSAERVRGGLDTLFSQVVTWQGGGDGTTPRPPGSILTPQLVRAPDGVWYLDVGLQGPAITVAEHWLVVSWSPEAVRRNLAVIAAAPASQPAASRPADSQPATRPQDTQP